MLEKSSLILDEISIEELQFLYGVNNSNIELIEKKLNCQITTRGNEVIVFGDQTLFESVKKILLKIIEFHRGGKEITEADIIYIIDTYDNKSIELESLNKKVIIRNQKGKIIQPKTKGQLDYINALEKYDLVFGVGPAGTGKTYLAVVYAVKQLKENVIKKIVLTRPAVEAGESLGFLPGDLKEKVDPYLRPLYDALEDMLSREVMEKLIERGVIEIAPLAYMRGRTLDDAYIILDEAQNTTYEQMKMFLTRMGFNSKMIVTGDLTQVDLPKGTRSGLGSALNILRDVEDIKIIELKEIDVVRHPLVRKIIRAYDNYKQ